MNVRPVTQTALAKTAEYRNASLRVTTPNRSCSPMSFSLFSSTISGNGVVVALTLGLAKKGNDSCIVSLEVVLPPWCPMITPSPFRVDVGDEALTEFDVVIVVSFASCCVDFVSGSANLATIKAESSVRRELGDRRIRFRYSF